MAAVTRDGWPGTGQRMIGLDNPDNEAPAPQGKKWECCTSCQGRGKVLVDDVGGGGSSIPRPGSVPLSAGAEERTRR